MNISESFLTALDSLVANKLRSILTMLGVIIGVGAVISLMAIGNGFSTFLEGEINSIGTNLIFVAPDTEKTNGRPSLGLNDLEALNDRSRAPALEKVGGALVSGQEITANGFGSRASINGVTSNYGEINNLGTLQYGDFVSDFDYDSRSRVVVIGYDIAEDIFGEDPFPIGETVKINGAAYEVIGMFEKEGPGAFGNSTGNETYIPLTTFLDRISNRRTIHGDVALSFITVQGSAEYTSAEAVEQITSVLREQHGMTYADDDDFVTGSQEDLLDTFGAITGALTVFLGFIAGISLLVGGIGIMNIMLVSVTERTREIGIRKALGALRRDILSQFIIESMFLSLLGGLIGIGLGWLVAYAVRRFSDFTTVVDINSIILSVSVSLFVGLFFGIYPAWRAARLRPIEALRYE